MRMETLSAVFRRVSQCGSTASLCFVILSTIMMSSFNIETTITILVCVQLCTVYCHVRACRDCRSPQCVCVCVISLLNDSLSLS